MKSGFISSLILAFLIWGCNNSSPSQNDGSKEAPTTIGEKEIETLEGQIPSCYLYATERDTVYLKLLPPVNGKVKGDLNYYFFERDGNTGHIEGEIHGDTLFADYTFQSEGLISVREVAFLLGEGQVMEGYGDVEEKDGRMFFWHRDSLDFSHGLILPEVPCNEVE